MYRGNILPAPPGKTLVCYLPVGDPLMVTDMADVYVACGVDALEIGFPVFDPQLDGRWVRESMARSLKNGLSAADWTRMLSGVRSRFPHMYIVGMGYTDLSGHVIGDDGKPLVDALLELERGHAGTHENVKRVAFVSTRLGQDEVAAARSATAYVMLQANDGKTGLRPELPEANRARIDSLRRAGVGTPILLGFGISTPAQAAEAIAFGADGVIVGSACIDAAMQGRDALASLVRGLRAAVDG